jgi:glycosyltransferase involved in cell wall biosynthesis
MIVNAIMCVWNEEDIICSTVRHAFAQGCANVYIIDNGSSDQTIEEAKKAGATHFATFHSKYFDEIKKIAQLNAAVEALNASCSDEAVWWLYIDADEFPSISASATIIDFLKNIASDCRAVHGLLYNHIPTHEPYMVRGKHPADFMPVCNKTDTVKIPLLRYDKCKEHIFSLGGAHSFKSSDDIKIVYDMLAIHHFPYRKPEDTRKRLALLAQTSPDRASRLGWMDNYARKIQGKPRSTYHDRLERLDATYAENRFRNLDTDSLPYGYRQLVRWYDPLSSFWGGDATVDAHSVAFHIWKATHLFFMAQYELALCGLHDAFSQTQDNDVQERLMLGMARCFLAMSDAGACVNVLKSIARSNSRAVRASAVRLMETALASKGEEALPTVF